MFIINKYQDIYWFRNSWFYKLEINELYKTWCSHLKIYEDEQDFYIPIKFHHNSILMNLLSSHAPSNAPHFPSLHLSIWVLLLLIADHGM